MRCPVVAAGMPWLVIGMNGTAGTARQVGGHIVTMGDREPTWGRGSPLIGSGARAAALLIIRSPIGENLTAAGVIPRVQLVQRCGDPGSTVDLRHRLAIRFKKGLQRQHPGVPIGRRPIRAVDSDGKAHMRYPNQVRA